MMTNYMKADISANIAFRSLINENKLNANDAVHILNGMLVEWQREAYFQTLVSTQQEQNATQNVENKE